MVKSYKIVYYRPVYENLISKLRDMWPGAIVTEEEYNTVRSSYNTTKFIVKGTTLNKLRMCFEFYVTALNLINM